MWVMFCLLIMLVSNVRIQPYCVSSCQLIILISYVMIQQYCVRSSQLIMLVSNVRIQPYCVRSCQLIMLISNVRIQPYCVRSYQLIMHISNVTIHTCCIMYIGEGGLTDIPCHIHPPFSSQQFLDSKTVQSDGDLNVLTMEPPKYSNIWCAATNFKFVSLSLITNLISWSFHYKCHQL